MDFVVTQGHHPKFRFRVRLEDGGKVLFAVHASSPWPVGGQNVFCLRDEDSLPDDAVEIERVRVVEWRKYGVKLSFSLDRPTKKRAEFLVLTKGYKQKQGAYEQIFFRTEAAIHQHRSKGAPALHGAATLHVVIDSQEKYPWTFPGAQSVQRRKLAAGDYALLHGERIVAVVERKTFANLITDIYSAQTLRNKLSELSAYERAAMVVEGQYADLTDTSRLPPQCSPSHLARMVGELAATHPKVPLVWAGNRKHANAWTGQFFTAAARAAELFVPEGLAELDLGEASAVADGGLDQALRRVVRQEETFKRAFPVRQLVAAVPGADIERARRILDGLRNEGAVICVGRGRAARWHRTGT